MSLELQKKLAAEAAVSYINDGDTIGVGTGSTVNYFVEALGMIRDKITGTVASSRITAERLMRYGLKVIPLNQIKDVLPLYVDGADEVDNQLRMIKGGGAALTGEKIVSSMAEKFICIAESSKRVDKLGKFPLPVEIIPIACNHITKIFEKLGGVAIPREGITTDYGNMILDVRNLEFDDPQRMEEFIDHIPGVVTNGLFARRGADLLLLGTVSGVTAFTPRTIS